MMFNTKLLLLPIVAQMVKNLPTMQERRGTDAFELWCWRRLLRVPWTVRRSNQSILKEISPGISLEGIMLKLKLQRSWGSERFSNWLRVTGTSS